MNGLNEKHAADGKERPPTPLARSCLCLLPCALLGVPTTTATVSPLSPPWAGRELLSSLGSSLSPVRRLSVILWPGNYIYPCHFPAREPAGFCY